MNSFKLNKSLKYLYLKYRIMGKRLIVTESEKNHIKKMYGLIKEDKNEKFYGDKITSIKAMKLGRKQFYGALCNDEGSIEVDVTTEKNGEKYMNMTFCIDFDINGYRRGYQPSGWDPGDPGDLEFDITLLKGIWERHDLNSPIKPDFDSLSGDEYDMASDKWDEEIELYNEQVRGEFSEDQLKMLQNDEDFMGKLYDDWDIIDIVVDSAEDNMRDY